VPALKELPVSSSKHPEFAPREQELFRNTLTLLNQHGVPYCVSGAFALHEHTGIWRDTKDLDLFLPPEEVGRALEVLSGEGYRCEVTDDVWLAKASSGEFFVDLITGMSNCIIRVDHSWIERSTMSEVLGIPCRVLAAEELLASKLFVNFRERFDGADTAHLIYRAGAAMDWSRVMALIGEHWGILLFALNFFSYAYPAYTRRCVPSDIWEDLMERQRKLIAGPAFDAPFRGSLLDERMFAIDVSEWGLENQLEEARVACRDRLGKCKPAA
jgi:hypothetical protein